METGNTLNKHASGTSKSTKKTYPYADIQYVKCFSNKKNCFQYTLQDNLLYIQKGRIRLIAEDYISMYTMCEHSGRISIVALVGFTVSHGIIPESNRD